VPDLRLKTVIRTAGANEAIKDGTLTPLSVFKFNQAPTVDGARCG